MDQSSSTPQDGLSRTLLGFFLQPIFKFCHNPRDPERTKTRFLPATNKGKELQDGKWGSLDSSLSFIGQKVYVAASSGGFLLCFFEIMQQQTYCICNPVTQEWRMLPRPNKIYQDVALSFSCRGNETQLDKVHFTVIRAGVVNCGLYSTKLELETYSSETGQWRESTVTCAKPFKLVVWNLPAFQLHGIIYWRDVCACLVAYNPATQRSELIQPPDPQSFLQFSDVWDPSQGGIFYARHDRTHLELWTIEQKCVRSYGHVLVARVSLAAMFKLTPETAAQRGKEVYNDLGIEAIHPHNSRQILVTWNGKPYWYNFESGNFLKFRDFLADEWTPVSLFLPYEWPSDTTTSQ